MCVPGSQICPSGEWDCGLQLPKASCSHLLRLLFGFHSPEEVFGTGMGGAQMASGKCVLDEKYLPMNGELPVHFRENVISV